MGKNAPGRRVRKWCCGRDRTGAGQARRGWEGLSGEWQQKGGGAGTLCHAGKPSLAGQPRAAGELQSTDYSLSFNKISIKISFFFFLNLTMYI